MAALLLFLLVGAARAFYVPGVAPTDFAKGDSIEIRAIKMTSTHTQLPYDYYSLPFCLPQGGKIEYKSQVRGSCVHVGPRNDSDFFLLSRIWARSSAVIGSSTPRTGYTWRRT